MFLQKPCARPLTQIKEMNVQSTIAFPWTPALLLVLAAALKYDPTNVRFLGERSSLYEQLGEHKMAMDGYRRILILLAPSDGERFMQLARDVAKWAAFALHTLGFAVPQQPCG